jgi:hypothetical protein
MPRPTPLPGAGMLRLVCLEAEGRGVVVVARPLPRGGEIGMLGEGVVTLATAEHFQAGHVRVTRDGLDGAPCWVPFGAVTAVQERAGAGPLAGPDDPAGVDAPGAPRGGRGRRGGLRLHGRRVPRRLRGLGQGRGVRRGSPRVSGGPEREAVAAGGGRLAAGLAGLGSAPAGEAGVDDLPGGRIQRPEQPAAEPGRRPRAQPLRGRVSRHLGPSLVTPTARVGA